jgi:putative membrane protein
MSVPVMHETWGAWPLLAPLWILLWIVVIATAIRFLARRRGGAWCGPRRDQGPTATEVLAGRFAQGEIDVAEYRARIDVLRQ